MRSALAQRIGLAFMFAMLGACHTESTSVQVASAGPMVQPAMIAVVPPENGVITIRGLPGAVAGSGVTTVAIAVTRESAAERTTQHLGHGVRPFYTTYAKVTPDGGFEQVTLGDERLPVQVADELNFTPYQGTVPVGGVSSIAVPSMPIP